MTGNTSRRAFLALACAPAALLAACGSSTIESALKPSRFLSVGDGFSDLGQTGTRYTVNDNSTSIWTEQLAASYSLTIKAAASGGLSYAQGGARVTTAGTVPTIEAQVTTLLAANTLGTSDVVLLSGGISDIVAEVTALGISTQTTTNVRAAGTALGVQVRRLVTAGAHYVLVAGVYNLGLSPWAVGLGKVTDLTNLSNQFNEAFKIEIVDLGANVRYVDTALYFNLVHSAPSGYSLVNVTDKACSTTDASTCTSSTIVSGIDYTTTLFADAVYLTPAANRLFGTYAYAQLQSRW